MRGHQCQRLFYLECANFVEDDAAEAAATVEAAAGELAALPAAQTADAQPTVSLYAIAGIRTAHAMRLPVTINGCRLVALLDSGSTHNFIDTKLLRRLRLNTSAHPTIHVLVANGDRAPCHGFATSVALTVDTEDFDLRLFGIDLGGIKVILGVEFLYYGTSTTCA